MTPEQYCQAKASGSGSSFYHSFRFLPPPKRKAITALYAFCREVDDIVDECREPHVAARKLDWWRQEIASCYQGTPQHPVSRALQPVIREFDLPEEPFQELIAGMAMDLQPRRYRDFEELELYCYRVASTVGLLAARIFGQSHPDTLEYAKELGLSLQYTNILRDIAEDYRIGRVYVPESALNGHGLTPQDLQGPDTDARHLALFRELAERSRRHRDRAMRHLPNADRANQKTGLLMGAIYHGLLEEIERQGFPVLQRRVSLPTWKKLWIAWSTAFRERRQLAN